MLYVIWEVLNCIALYVLVQAVFKAQNLLSREWGALKTGAFCIVLLSTCHGRSGAPAASPTASVAATGDASGVALGPYFVTIAAEPMSKIVLTVVKGATTNPASLQVVRSVAGTFLGGHRWAPISTGSYRIEKDHFTYSTAELLHWQLLGITVFTQVKTLSGTTILR